MRTHVVAAPHHSHPYLKLYVRSTSRSLEVAEQKLLTETYLLRDVDVFAVA